jgi:hypothetical protein
MIIIDSFKLGSLVSNTKATHRERAVLADAGTAPSMTINGTVGRTISRHDPFDWGHHLLRLSFFNS